MTINNIDKPIKVFDLETTGLNKQKDSIIQFAGITVDPKTCKIIDTLNLFIRPEGNYEITLGAYYKHNISPQILNDKPTFKEVAQQIRDFFSGDFVVLTYNGLSFDLSFLAIEFNRIGEEFSLLDKELYDSFLIEKKRNNLTLEGRFQHYYGCTMADKGLQSHNALSDVKATFMVFAKQQQEEPFGPEEVLTECNTINLMEFKDELKPCFTVGKYRGIPIEVVYNIDKQYLEWVISNSCTFSPSCKKYVKQYIDSQL